MARYAQVRNLYHVVGVLVVVQVFISLLSQRGMLRLLENIDVVHLLFCCFYINFYLCCLLAVTRC